MVKALRILLAGGGTCITEAHNDCCVESLEVASTEIEVPEGTLCDICEEPITDASEEVNHEPSA